MAIVWDGPILRMKYILNDPRRCSERRGGGGLGPPCPGRYTAAVHQPSRGARTTSAFLRDPLRSSFQFPIEGGALSTELRTPVGARASCFRGAGLYQLCSNPFRTEDCNVIKPVNQNGTTRNLENIILCVVEPLGNR